MYAVLCATPWASVSAKRTFTSVWKWHPCTRETLRMAVSLEELQLAARNHGMPLEALRFDVTPVGLHYLLVHYDVPVVDLEAWSLTVGGAVEEPLTLSLEDLRLRHTETHPVTMECAGNGRALLDPRPISQP